MESGHQQIKSVLKEVRKIEIKTHSLVEGLLQGAYHSVFKGRGIEFSDTREYMEGDDIRNIDWNITARMNKPYVKEFIEERDLTLYIMLDVSKSTRFGGIKEKREYAACIAASLFFAAMRNNDNMGLILFTNKLEKFIPARKGRKHALMLIREILNYKPENLTTDLNEPIRKVSKILKKKAIIFVLSDFMCADFRDALKKLCHRHEVILMRFIDPSEAKLPDIGRVILEDAETGEQIIVNTSDKNFRKEYEKLMKSRKNKLTKMLRSMGVSLIDVKTDEPFEVPLKKFFGRRLR